MESNSQLFTFSAALAANTGRYVLAFDAFSFE
jgi:hypothetical protein